MRSDILQFFATNCSLPKRERASGRDRAGWLLLLGSAPFRAMEPWVSTTNIIAGFDKFVNTQFQVGAFHFWGEPLRRLRTTLDMRQISVDRDALGLKSAPKPSQGSACPRTEMHLFKWWSAWDSNPYLHGANPDVFPLR